MGGGGTFKPMIEIVAFLSVLWGSGRFCRHIHISPIIGEILVGMAFGPKGLDLVPYVHVESHDHSHIPSIWEIMGTIGVTLMIAESGTHIHFDKIRKVGLAALVVAVVGTFAPLAMGMAFAYLFAPKSSVETAFAAGCALAPTSVGVALKLLTDAKQLNSMPGQTIVTAAFLDDVFSIILLVVLLTLTATSSSNLPGGVQIFLVCLEAFIFIAAGAALSIWVYPKVFPWILKKIPEKADLTYQPRDEMHLVFMLALLVFYGYIGNLIGSHLLGAFVAGMSFSQVSRSMYVWRRQLKRIAAWLIRFFFACSVAFTIPVKSLFSATAFWQGVVFAAVPTILGKIVAGLASWQYKWVVGFAMVGRGEFAYLVAQQAEINGLLTSELYAVVVWALLLAVLIAPVAFRHVLDLAFQDKESFGMKYFRIQAEGHHHTGAHFEIVDVLHDLHLDILEAKVETDGDVDAIEFVVAVSGDDDLDEDKIEEVLKDIKQAINDDEAQVHILPVDERDVQHLVAAQASKMNATNSRKGHLRTSSMSLLDNDHMVEVRLMAKHEPHLLLQIVDCLYEMGIQVVKGHMEEYYHTDSEIIYGRPIYDGEIEPVLDIHEIKDRLQAKLHEHGLKNEVMVRPIHVTDVVMPHHVKMSEYMTTHRENNPFVDEERGACGYEIDIECEDRPKILHTISTCLQDLNLDVREADVDDDVENHQWKSTFFVQETNSDKFSPNKRRRLIERKLISQFQRNNMEALVKVRPVHSVSPRKSPSAKKRGSVEGVSRIDASLIRSESNLNPKPISEEHASPKFTSLSMGHIQIDMDDDQSDSITAGQSRSPAPRHL